MKNNLLANYLRPFLLIFVLLISTKLMIRSIRIVTWDDINLIGSRNIKINQLIENSSMGVNERLFLVKTKLIENELKENLSLKNVSVTRQLFPFGLKIYIEERIPVAHAQRILSNSIIKGFIDEDGHFIPQRFANISQKTSPIRVEGWQKKFIASISKIIKAYKMHDESLLSIKISPEGNFIVEEKILNQILLGTDIQKLDKQLNLIFHIKDQIRSNDISIKIESLDLTDPVNPILKVFKP